MNRIIRKIRSSVSIQVAILVTITVVTISSVYSYSHYIEVKTDLFQNTELQLLRIVEGIAKPVEIFLRTKDYDSLHDLIENTSNGADIELIVVFDTMARVVACNKPKWLGKDLYAMHPEDVTKKDIAAVQKAINGGYVVYYDKDDNQYCLAIPVYNGSGVGGAIHLSLDRSNLQTQIKEKTAKIFIISILISLVTGIVLYYLLHALLTKRIKTVAASAERLAAGDMSARADVAGTDEISYLATSFNLLGEEITNWRTNLEEMVISRVKELQTLYEVAYTISRSLDFKTVLREVLDLVLGAMNEQKGMVILAGDEGDTFSLVSQRGLSAEAVGRVSRTKMGEGWINEIITGNKAKRFSTGDGYMPENLAGIAQDGVKSILAVPISARGVAFGVITVFSSRKEKFTDDEESLLSTIGNQVAVAAENARLYERTLELAREDGLTGLANRRHLMDLLIQEVGRACRYEMPLSILMLDLDRFKRFNDTYGHLKGDELLREFGNILKNSIRSTDIAGRYGGEEFSVILTNTSLKGAIVIAERIRKFVETLKITVNKDVPPQGITVSIGIAELAPGETHEDLLAAADAALYRAKEGGRNRLAW